MPVNEHSVTVNAAPAKVWSVISNADNLLNWLSPIKGLDKNESGPITVGRQMKGQLGNANGASLRFKTVDTNRQLAWNAGPAMAHMMMMPMKVSISIDPAGDDASKVTARFRSAMMIAPMMKAMSGLDFSEEVVTTVNNIKEQAESA